MAIYDNYRIRFNTALNSLEMNVGGEDWELVPSGAGGDITANDITMDGTLVQDTTYSFAPSFQGIAGDTTLAATAGRDKGDGGAFLAAIMGNVHGTTLTKTGNYLAGVIGAYDLQGTNASELPKAAVLGIIFDGSTTADGIVVAEIDGSDPSAVTRANACFKGRMLNTNAGSGVDYGLDLYDTAVSGYMSSPTLPLAIANADIRMTNQVVIMNGAGAPTNGVTGANFAAIGSLYMNTTSGAVYSNTGTQVSPVWASLGGGGGTYSTYVPTIVGAGTPTGVSFVTLTTSDTVTVWGFFIAGTVTATTFTLSLPTPINNAHVPTGGTITGNITRASASVGSPVFLDGTDANHAFVQVAGAPSDTVYSKANGNGFLDDNTAASVTFTYPL